MFVALQHCLTVATHWLADARLDVPATYRDTFVALGARGVVQPELASRLAAGSGMRNLLAHRYGTLERSKVYAAAAHWLDDLLQFCTEIEAAAARG